MTGLNVVETAIQLDVGIVGAGIAGLSAAIALVRAGHRVDVSSLENI